jgi:hypothetical protein
MNDTRFWNSVEKLENEFCGSSIDEREFRRKMCRKGFDKDVIEERVEAVRDQYRSIYGVDHISINDR